MNQHKNHHLFSRIQPITITPVSKNDSSVKDPFNLIRLMGVGMCNRNSTTLW